MIPPAHPTLLSDAIKEVGATLRFFGEAYNQRYINDKRLAQERSLHEKSIQFQALQHKEKMLAQYLEGEANRQTQIDIAKVNSLVALFRDERNNQFQEKLKLLEIEQQKANRSHATELEKMRLAFQAWALEKQRDLQMEIKQREESLAREVAAYERETQLGNLREAKHLNKLPVWIDLRRILGRTQQDEAQTVHVFFSPPSASLDLCSGLKLPMYSIESNLGSFLRQYEQNARPVNFMSGAWENPALHGKAAAEAIFSEIPCEPVIILENKLEENTYFINIAFWIDNAKKPEFINLIQFSLPDLTATDTNATKQRSELTNTIVLLNSILVGLKVDEYFLIHTTSAHTQKPLLPDIINGLLPDLSAYEKSIVIDMVLGFYQFAYHRMAQQQSAWIPEIKLDLAETLAKLSFFKEAEHELELSLRALLLRYIPADQLNDSHTIFAQLSCLPPSITKSRRSYFYRLHQLLASLPNAQKPLLRTLEIYMNNSNRLAIQMLDHATLVKQEDDFATYSLQLNEEMTNVKEMFAIRSVGKRGANPQLGKNILVIGETGAGKTTLINAMANYILGVEYEDKFRFRLIYEEGMKSDQPNDSGKASSQTQFVTAYSLYQMDEERRNSSDYDVLTIVDMPGFGATEGVNRDKGIVNQVRKFLYDPKTITYLNAICFVVKASESRLTDSQQFVFDLILSLFDKDAGNIMYIMVTFCDSGVPPAINTLEDAKIPYKKAIEFYNPAMLDKQGPKKKLFWSAGMDSFKDFFEVLSESSQHNLERTKEVLKQRHKLEAICEGLMKAMELSLSKIEELRQQELIVKRHEAEIEINKNFKFKIKVPKVKEIIAPQGKYNTTCLGCHITCHPDCAFEQDADKDKCAVMGKDGLCKICGCHYSRHRNLPYMYERYEEEVEQTYEDLKRKYDIASQGKQAATQLEERIKADFIKNCEELFGLVLQNKETLAKIAELALKPDPLTSVGYINKLIEGEVSQQKLGWKERKQTLETLKKHAEYVNLDSNHEFNKVLSEVNKNKFRSELSGLLGKLGFWKNG